MTDQTNNETDLTEQTFDHMEGIQPFDHMEGIQPFDHMEGIGRDCLLPGHPKYDPNAVNKDLAELINKNPETAKEIAKLTTEPVKAGQAPSTGLDSSVDKKPFIDLCGMGVQVR